MKNMALHSYDSFCIQSCQCMGCINGGKNSRHLCQYHTMYSMKTYIYDMGGMEHNIFFKLNRLPGQCNLGYIRSNINIGKQYN